MNVPRLTGWLEHAGERIYYEVAGSEGAPWLILCHGAGGNHAVWHHQVARFCGTYRVLAWDQRGFGRSTNREGAASPQAAAADLAALVTGLGIRRAHVVGQSMGGWAAMGFCVAHPDVAMSLTLADTLGGIPVAAWAAGRLSPRPVDAVVGDHPALGARFCREHPAQALLYQQLGDWGVPSNERAGAVTGLFTTSFGPEELARVRCPVLFVVGGEDEIFPPAWIAEAAGHLPQATVEEIPGAGHSPYFEVPEQWNAAVGRHLEASSLA
ncbi:MAG TPA: alpha/beta hydrolase [Acidimicrobiales bacterium]|nr:alpha/beta hydrolase [Acidimicrobiales bacterium]